MLYNCASICSDLPIYIGGSSVVNIERPIRKINFHIGGSFTATINSLKKLIGDFEIFRNMRIEDAKNPNIVAVKNRGKNLSPNKSLRDCFIEGTLTDVIVSYATKGNINEIHTIKKNKQETLLI